LGITDGSSNYPLFPWWKQHYGAIYVHDDWKVTRKLTLNVGLRYDLYQGQYEKWNRMNGPFDPTVARLLRGCRQRGSYPGSGTAIPAALNWPILTLRTKGGSPYWSRQREGRPACARRA
jgi:outer membrane receptor protein involved in Fe transport